MHWLHSCHAYGGYFFIVVVLGAAGVFFRIHAYGFYHLAGDFGVPTSLGVTL